jgi:hypothetical protein
LEFIDLDKNKIKLLHPGLFAGLQFLSEVWLKKNPIVSADFKTSNFTLMEMSETLKPLFDNYMEKFGGNSLRDHNGREKFEDLKMKMAEKDKIIENLTAKISQTNEELRKVKGVTKKLAEDRKKDTLEISLELLSNYAKLRATEGDIKFEFADGYILKGHKTILAGNFHSKLFAYQFGFYEILLTAHSTKFAEIFAAASPDIIKLSDMKIEAMDKVMNFLYTGKLTLDPDDVIDVMGCAKRFKIPVLKKYLIQNSEKLININNFLVYYKEANEENLKFLETKVLKFFAG